MTMRLVEQPDKFNDYPWFLYIGDDGETRAAIYVDYSLWMFDSTDYGYIFNLQHIEQINQDMKMINQKYPTTLFYDNPDIAECN